MQRSNTICSDKLRLHAIHRDDVAGHNDRDACKRSRSIGKCKRRDEDGARSCKHPNKSQIFSNKSLVNCFGHQVANIMMDRCDVKDDRDGNIPRKKRDAPRVWS